MPYDNLLSTPFETVLHRSIVEGFSRKIAEQLIQKYPRANICITEDKIERKRRFKLAVYVDFIPLISTKKQEE